MFSSIHDTIRLFACVLATMVLASAQAAADLKEVQATVDQLQKVIEDELSDAAMLEVAEEQLLAILDKGEVKKDPPANSPEAKVIKQIADLVLTVRARLPEFYSGGGGRRSVLTVPNYSQEKLVGKIADQLHKTQEQFIADYRKSPDSKPTRNGLIETVVAQELLAWEVAWPYSAAEAKAVKTAGKLTKEVYLSRRNRGVELINKHLDADFENVGRMRPLPFAILCPAAAEDQKRIEERIVKARGEAGAAWIEGTKQLDEKYQERFGAQ